MTNQDPSEVRCPNCGRLTPFAPFCTHCGAVIQEGAAGARPHAMDRAELERRIRQRRQEGPFHRGADEHPGDPGVVPSGVGAFVPEPADELARNEQSVADEQARVDYFDESAARQADPDQIAAGASGFAPGAGGIPGAAVPPSRVDWPSRDLDEPEPSGTAGSSDEAAVGAAAASGAVSSQEADAVAKAPHGAAGIESPAPRPYQPATPYVPERAYEPVAAAPYEPPRREADAYEPGSPYGAGDDGSDDGDDTGWRGYDDEPPRRGSGLAILGFLILGLAALLGGAFLFAAINAPKPAAQVTSPSPSASGTGAETASPTEPGTPSEGGSGSPTAAASDNFSAKVEPCASSRMGFSGCVDDGTHLSGNQVWVWVGFKNGQASTVLGVTIVSQATKSAVADGSLELDRLVGCDPGKSCSGYMQMSFGNLDPGAYQIKVTRDGDPAASTNFTVGS